jgi:hypothetical protein
MIRIKVYYIDTPVESPEDLKNKESFLIQKKSLLKGGFRAYLLNDPQEIKDSAWVKKFQDKENVEFYIKDSGVYRLVNMDLVEGELYFEKSETPVYHKKCIFVDMPFDGHFQNGLLKKLKEEFSERIEIGTISDYTKFKGAIKLDDEILKVIRSSLIFIADITPLNNKNLLNSKDKWLANSNVMLELGFALAEKNKNNIIITYDKAKKDNLQFPFDIQTYLNKSYDTSVKNGFDDIIKIIDSKLYELNIKYE